MNFDFWVQNEHKNIKCVLNILWPNLW